MLITVRRIEGKLRGPGAARARGGPARPSRSRRATPKLSRGSRAPLVIGGIAAGVLLAGAAVYLLTRAGPATRAVRTSGGETGETGGRSRVNYSDENVARWARQLDARDLRSRTAAANALAALGPRAREAVPDLLAAMAQPSAGIEFEMALGKAMKAIGAAAAPGLIEGLGSGEPRIRFQATQALARLGAHAQSAVQALTNTLKDDPDYTVRSGAAVALGSVGPAASSALPALREAAGSRHASLTHDPLRAELRVRARVAIEQITGTE